MKLILGKELYERVADAIIQQTAPGYPGIGEYFAVDTTGDGILDSVYFRDRTAQWNPWHDNAVAVAVSSLVDPRITIHDDEDDADDDEIKYFVIDNLITEIEIDYA